MEKVTSEFQFKGKPISCERYGSGHINITYLVVTNEKKRYILQRLNKIVFKDRAGLMYNVEAVTSFLARKYDDPRQSLHLVPTIYGKTYFVDSEGEYWRAFDFVEGSICLQKARTVKDFANTAVAFGKFQSALLDFPAETLNETIADFHNTPVRYIQFEEAVQRDAAGRADSVREEIEFILSRKGTASVLQQQLTDGTLPLKVTHNDTKLNNVLFDKKTGDDLCVIDLDTIMPGLVAYDFGDSIRFGASTAPEDEKDLRKVEMDMDLYRVYYDSFVSSCPGLTDAEIRSLPYGAKIITLENALRFLMDYLDGDIYYNIARPEHNLDRARAQCKLVLDMESKFREMVQICEEHINP